MRICYLSPGTGSYFCGTCLRDDALVRALRARGHEVETVPMYLPAFLGKEERADEPPVRMGAVNLYLQQKLGLARHLPRPLERLLDSPRLLRFVSRFAGSTDPELLGEMTLSMLLGEEGPLAHAVKELALTFAGKPRPDAILLSNALLCGVAGPLRESTGARIVCSLQGEAPFLDILPEPHRENAWRALAERARHVDLFIAVSRHYGERMAGRLGLASERVAVVLNGIDPEDLPVSETHTAPEHPTIGFLARMCEDKGLSLLVDAYLELRRRGSVPGVRLRVAGVALAEDRPLVATLQRRLRNAGVRGDSEFLPNISAAKKREFLRSLSVLSVPATDDESFGLYLLEANAMGVPVVEPRHAAFPEILEATGGGLLCDPGDPVALADGLEKLLLDGELARRLGEAGRRAVAERFTAARMAEEVESLLLEVSGT